MPRENSPENVQPGKEISLVSLNFIPQHLVLGLKKHAGKVPELLATGIFKDLRGWLPGVRFTRALLSVVWPLDPCDRSGSAGPA